ncbi:MAG TPA: hypothetical protein VI687_01340 [Candidatus Limnocylindrales bacterium]|jgi:hypothetical protein|nr:hypothetical protein [Candidatus Limnocylindrales bacterium]
MGFLMDLVAGDSREILLAISLDDWAGLDDPGRFDAHLALGGAMDPTWLDLFSEAVRDVTGRDEPIDFLDARRDLDGPGDIGDRTVERVDPDWISGIARVADRDIDAIAGRWIELVEEDLGALPREEKPWIRQFAADLIDFARKADLSPAVMLAWSL